MKLPKTTVNTIEVHIDATPDGNYALRILRHYRSRCNEKWSVTGSDDNAIYDAMNVHQDLRAAELDKAIQLLKEGVDETH